MAETLVSIKKIVALDIRLGKTVNMSDVSYLKTRVLPRVPDIGAKLEYFMSTGNLNSPSALDQMQVRVGCRH